MRYTADTLERTEPYSITLEARFSDHWHMPVIYIGIAVFAAIELSHKLATRMDWRLAEAPFWDYRWALALIVGLIAFALYAVPHVRQLKTDRTPVRVELSDAGLVIARRNRTIDRVDWDRIAHARRGADDRPSAFVLTDDAGRTVELWNGGFGVREWRTLRTTLTDELTRRGIDVADNRDPAVDPAPSHA